MYLHDIKRFAALKREFMRLEKRDQFTMLRGYYSSIGEDLSSKEYGSLFFQLLYGKHAEAVTSALRYSLEIRGMDIKF